VQKDDREHVNGHFDRSFNLITRSGFVLVFFEILRENEVKDGTQLFVLNAAVGRFTFDCLHEHFEELQTRFIYGSVFLRFREDHLPEHVIEHNLFEAKVVSEHDQICLALLDEGDYLF
jgi:hypothetical protein